jgi:hypothetical protein
MMRNFDSGSVGTRDRSAAECRCRRENQREQYRWEHCHPSGCQNTDDEFFSIHGGELQFFGEGIGLWPVATLTLVHLTTP